MSTSLKVTNKYSSTLWYSNFHPPSIDQSPLPALLHIIPPSWKGSHPIPSPNPQLKSHCSGIAQSTAATNHMKNFLTLVITVFEKQVGTLISTISASDLTPHHKRLREGKTCSVYFLGCGSTGLWGALILGYLIGEDRLRLRYLSENSFAGEGVAREHFTCGAGRRRRTTKRNGDKIDFRRFIA